jgi:hypothetical protein
MVVRVILNRRRPGSVVGANDPSMGSAAEVPLPQGEIDL